MPLPAALIPAYQAAATYLPGVAPLAGAAVFSLGMVATHTPDTLQLASRPEMAAECIRRNVASLDPKLAATIVPLYGTESMGVTLKRSVVSPPLFNVVLTESGSGAVANYKVLQQGHEPDVQKVFAGC